MEPSLELFDTHADQVFARFLQEGQSRERALASTEAFFMVRVTQKKRSFEPYFRLTKA